MVSPDQPWYWLWVTQLSTTCSWFMIFDQFRSSFPALQWSNMIKFAHVFGGIFQAIDRSRCVLCLFPCEDLHCIKKHLPFPSPAVLGHEISGTVVEHGDGVDARRFHGGSNAGRLPLVFPSAVMWRWLASWRIPYLNVGEIWANHLI